MNKNNNNSNSNTMTRQIAKESQRKMADWPESLRIETSVVWQKASQPILQQEETSIGLLCNRQNEANTAVRTTYKPAKTEQELFDFQLGTWHPTFSN